MRDVSNGWFLRYLHANGASVFFIAVYLHVFRGLYYGSYTSPRESLWCIGVVLPLRLRASPTGMNGPNRLKKHPAKKGALFYRRTAKRRTFTWDSPRCLAPLLLLREGNRAPSLLPRT